MINYKQKELRIYLSSFFIYKIFVKSPIIRPNIFPIEENRPEYLCLDSGISSQVII